MTQQFQQRPGGGNSPGAFAAGQFASRATAAGGAYIGSQAGRNHYERTGDLKEAMWLGAISGRRWTVWLLAWLVWLFEVVATFCIMMNYNVSHQDYLSNVEDGASARYIQYAMNDYLNDRAMFFAWGCALPVTFLLLLVIYRRNIDFSLFSRGQVYHLISPVAALLFWAPNWLIYSGLIIVPVSFQFLFGFGTHGV